jgi:PITH domain
MPTFIFYRNRSKIDRIQGADIQGLEAKIKQHVGADTGAADDGEDYGQGLMDLSTFVMKNMCECLNESDDHTLEHAMNNGAGYLASDVDEQLIINLAFNQGVKIHSLKLKAPAKHGPKKIKLFINQPVTLDFDSATCTAAVQEIDVSPKDLENGNMINLRFVKFQNVQTLTFFVVDNQSGDEKTVIESLQVIGAPIATTKMDDFKRIAGKKGESH